MSRAIILAAGKGSRMGSLTEEKPKCLVELAGKPLIQWQTEAIKKAGIKDIAIVRGYLGEKLTLPGATYFANSRWSQTNMVMSLVAAGDWLEKYTCIISYADIVYSASVVAELNKKEGDILISYDPNWLELWSKRFKDPLSDAETFKIDRNGTLLEIGGKTKNANEIQGQYMGLLKFTPAGWATVKSYLSSLTSGEYDSLDMTSLLRRLLKLGTVISTVPIRGRWLEVDSESDLTLYHSLLKSSPEAYLENG